MVEIDFKCFYVNFWLINVKRALFFDDYDIFYDHAKIIYCNPLEKYDDIFFVIYNVVPNS